METKGKKIIQGPLYRRRGPASWKRRWIVLRAADGVIGSFAEDDGELKLKGKLRVRQVAEAGDIFTVSDGGTTFEFMAESSDAKMRWIAVLSEVAKGVTDVSVCLCRRSTFHHSCRDKKFILIF